MSRTSVRTFLVTAKRHLQSSLHDQGKGTASFVIGNESADLDSITCALVYAYIHSCKPEARQANHVVLPVINIPSADLRLRPELTALLRHADVNPSDLISLDDLGTLPLPLASTDWTLVDHNALQGALGKHYTESVTGCIDHHVDEHSVPPTANPRIVTKSGSCASLVTNHVRSIWDDLGSASTSIGAANGQSSDGILDDTAYTSTWDAQVAKLALASILIDTFDLTSENKVTEHDISAVRYLEARINASPKLGKDYDRKKFFDEINSAKSHLDGLSLNDILRKDYKQWSEGSLKLGMSSVVKDVAYLRHQTEANKDFPHELNTFATERSLDLFAIMTAYTGADGKFARQLLLIVTEDGKGKEAAERFSEKCTAELQLANEALENATSTSLPFARLWRQGNLAASRKRVGPLLREAMREA
ncbi:hypothetical protein BAUCODRAFT_221231 [Baudoinia panamericana UAMH 10762]|uniref:DHHA2 domain-containing protein n=1 Tax=Baudoinia panamericana (strain UAMH 10762) TaxID=717646 RepID=M2MRL5_BAUPA|nr:uncharacterized protein BAUCODRAFT_221231 [Baudoinia panamericana UAMH 10762]EMC94113.1 hypothetical protein BAUCODRAFT_221231 [Baudoinia panamericana UAMH 10762]